MTGSTAMREEPIPAPRITVLMPMYNGEEHVAEAVASVLGQTFRDFELLAIDDGSTDGGPDVVRGFDDSRIRLVSNPRNLGLVPTLNRGLDLARGEYIARLDCDDVCLPERLERQLAFMENNPRVGIAGSWFEKWMDGRTIRVEVPESDALIRFFMIFDNAFLHSSMMLRRSLLDAHGLRYDPAFPHAEDYELWVRCARHTELANLPEVLARYRFHPANISSRFRDTQWETADRVRRLHLHSLGLEPTDEEFRLHLALINFRFNEGVERLGFARAWLDGCAETVRHRLGIPEAILRRELGRRWYGACGAAAGHGFEAWQWFRTSPLGRNAEYRWRAKLWLRCLLRRAVPVSHDGSAS